MSNSNELERGFINSVGDAYLAQAKVPDAEHLHNWRYRSLIPLLNRMHGMVSGMRRRQRQIDGHRVIWLEGGNPAGEPVLLIHGFGSSKENWLPLLPFLARRYRLYVIDLPGWGESQFKPDAAYGLDQQVARLASWCEAVLPGPVHVVGSSMGGGIAGLFAARHPQKTRSVTLMNAAGVAGAQTTGFERGLLSGRNSLIAHNMLGVFSLLNRVMDNRALAVLMAPGMYWELVSRRHVNAHMFRHLLQHEPDSALPAFGSVTVPALVLWGTEDQVLHVSCSATFKQLMPHAQVKLLKDVGHLPMVERPRMTARILRRFWREGEATREQQTVTA